MLDGFATAANPSGLHIFEYWALAVALKKFANSTLIFAQRPLRRPSPGTGHRMDAKPPTHFGVQEIELLSRTNCSDPRSSVRRLPTGPGLRRIRCPGCLRPLPCGRPSTAIAEYGRPQHLSSSEGRPAGPTPPRRPAGARC